MPFFGPPDSTPAAPARDAAGIPEKYRLASYDFALPPDRIAQHPPEQRTDSRLLAVDRRAGTMASLPFSALVEKIPADALLVVNDSKVLPARLYGHKASGGKVEFLLLTPLPLIKAFSLVDGGADGGADGVANGTADGTAGSKKAQVTGLLRASRALRPGQRVFFSASFFLEVLHCGEFGHSTVLLCWQGSLTALFEQFGQYPLPPYIRRPATQEDAVRYQTVYAQESKTGSVAAPTAGLHFTPEIQENLKKRGVQWAQVTLYVGYGTFSPVRCADIRDYSIHKEYIEITPAAAEKIQTAIKQGRPVIAVGTTSVRTLEGVFARAGAVTPFSGWTDIYLYPGSSFQVVDGLLTNFHLPQSSLLIMVCAFAGRKLIQAAYSKALQEQFRFFSYGDAMFIL